MMSMLSWVISRPIFRWSLRSAEKDFMVYWRICRSFFGRKSCGSFREEGEGGFFMNSFVLSMAGLKISKDWSSIDLKTSDEMFEMAEKNNLSVVVPDDWTLQIDIDSEEDFQEYQKRANLISRAIPLTEKIEPSFSGLPNRHVTLTSPFRMDVWKRIALQAALGSHSTRELFNAFRVLNEDRGPIVF